MSSESDQVMRGELAKPPILRGGGLLTIRRAVLRHLKGIGRATHFSCDESLE
jgi:hypothetical protein